MLTGERNDPYMGYRFLVEIDGLIVGGFTDVSGLDITVDTEDYREGGVNDHVHKLSKGVKQQNITLKRGLSDSDVLWKWHRDTVNGKIKRKMGRIVLLNSMGNEKWFWTFEDAWPVKWSGPELKADSDSVAIETLELSHNGIKKG